MPKRIHNVKLSEREKEELEKYVKQGKKSARAINRARVLLLANEEKSDGTCCVLLAFEPHTGFRYVQVRERRTAVDYAQFMKYFVELHYHAAECIRLVQDNLNTHTPGSFYEVLPPEEAFNLAQKFELHYTPKKGSWLNMAEIEFSALSKQCLDRRIPDIETLEKETLAWAEKRNKKCKTVNWKFTKDNAREKLKNKYRMHSN